MVIRQVDSLTPGARLGVRCFVHREFCRGIDLETLVGYGLATADRVPVGAGVDPLLGSGDGGEPIIKARGYGVVALFGGEALGRIAHVAARVGFAAVILAVSFGASQQPLDPGAL